MKKENISLKFIVFKVLDANKVNKNKVKSRCFHQSYYKIGK